MREKQRKTQELLQFTNKVTPHTNASTSSTKTKGKKDRGQERGVHVVKPTASVLLLEIPHTRIESRAHAA